jgi:CHAD domain-containing protein
MSSALPALSPDVSFRDAGKAILRHQLSLLIDALPGVFAGDPTAVHDLRVASRRLRASLAVFGKLFSAEGAGEIERQAARITEAFGVVRDLDVQIEALRAVREGLSGEAIYGVQRLIDRLAKQRTKERKGLKKLLDELGKGKLEKRLRRALDEVA